MKSIGLIGCGNLGSLIAQGVQKHLSDRYIMAFFLDSDGQAAERLAGRCGGRVCQTLPELLAHNPDCIVEAATADTLKEIAEPCLRAGCDVVALSAWGAGRRGLCGARRRGRGAQERQKAAHRLGRFGRLRPDERGAPVGRPLLPHRQPQEPAGAGPGGRPAGGAVDFLGNARDAIAAFPKNVNVAAAAAFASCGMQDTTVEVRCRPGLALNTHRVELEGDFGHAVIEVASRPSLDNPRSSALAADSVVACLQNLDAGIVF